MKNVYAIVLAAGKGKRMNSRQLPKMLYPIAGQPMLLYVVATLAKVGIEQPIIVVGFLADKIKELLNGGYQYVHQKKRLGTGHAVLACASLLKAKPGCTLIINGDQPFFRASTIKRLAAAITDQGATVAVLTGLMDSKEFDAFGRVMTDKTGHVLRIVELKDATPKERSIRLMNLGGYAVDNQWLWGALKKLKKSPASGEYYITDIVAEAVREGKKVKAITIENKAEAIGINTMDHLLEAERLFTASQSARPPKYSG